MNLREKLDLKLSAIVAILLVTFVIYSGLIKSYFGLDSPDYQEILGDRYFLYVLLNLFGLAIFCIVPFIFGLRYHIYRVRRDLDEVMKGEL